MSEMVCPNGFILAVEGLAKICIPDPDLYRRENGSYEPSWAPVFYNPRMVGNRDICVAFLKKELLESSGEAAILDPLAATGVRGIRIALEADIQKGSTTIYMGDISPDAVEVMKHNIKLNDVEGNIAVVHADANELIYQLARRSGIALGYIDIDPFGSPAPFIHAALGGVKRYGVVAVTATDLAVLEGRYRSKLFRRYGVAGVKAVQSKDIALRTLLSFVMRVAAIYDRYIEPILSYAVNHYVRIYIRVYRGGSKASETLHNCLGSIWCCTRCGYYIQQGDSSVDNVGCPVCGGRLERIHPVWICPIANREYLEKLIEVASEMPWLQKSSRALLESLYRTSAVNELTIRLTHIARAIKISTPPINTVISCLLQKGFIAVRSYTYSDGIITNAPINDVVECMKV